MTLAVAGCAACVLIPAHASALDTADSVTLTGTTSTNGIYAGYPFSLTGSYDNADNNAAEITAIFLPKGSGPDATVCPDDYAAAVQQIEMDAGTGSSATYRFSEMGEAADPEDASGTYSVALNAPVSPQDPQTTVQNVTQPGVYVACGYLLDSSGNTLADSGTALTFTVKSPTSTTTAQAAFGGPAGGPNSNKPSDLKLKVAPEHAIRAPGNNLIRVTGRVGVDTGQVGLVVTIKDTSAFNGCEGTNSQDEQIARTSGGGDLADHEQIDQSATGAISATVDLRFKRKTSGSAIVCAYVLNPAQTQDIAVGFYRFKLVAPKP